MGFSSEERNRRWQRARELMAAQGWAALLVSGEDGLCGGNFRYLADFRPVKGPTLLLLPLEGEPVLREGMTELEIDAELEYYCRLHGADRLFNVYATSSLAELPWSASARPLERGRAALLEISPQVGGYWTQLVRVVSIGKPAPLL